MKHDQEGLGEFQLVSFTLGNEEYGLDILKVQEINRMMGITKVPNAPDFIEGVINLRGRVIPIVNLRKKLAQSEKEFDKYTRIVVVNCQGKAYGLIVDAVSEVLRLSENSVEPPPPLTSSNRSEYVKGVGKLDKKLIILLDLDKLVVDYDASSIEKIAA